MQPALAEGPLTAAELTGGWVVDQLGGGRGGRGGGGRPSGGELEDPSR